MAHVQSGDKRALRKLYDRFKHILAGMIYKIIRNRQKTEDLLQEVFVQAREKAGQYYPQLGTVYRFLATTDRNKAIYRTQSRA